MDLTAEQQATLNAIKARVMKSARHLSAHQMAVNMNMKGVDYRGCSKGNCAQDVAEALCGVYSTWGGQKEFKQPTEDAINAECRRFRLVEGKRRFGVIEEDRSFLEAEIARREYEISIKEKATQADTNYRLLQEIRAHKAFIELYERCLIQLGRDPKAPLTALEQEVLDLLREVDAFDAYGHTPDLSYFMGTHPLIHALSNRKRD